MIRILYDALGLLSSPLLFPIFALKDKNLHRTLQRFGRWRLESGEFVWFHGASLGEINGLAPIVSRFRIRYPRAKILMSATSIAGAERAAELADVARLLPLDSKPWLGRAIKSLNIHAFVFAETEIWPNLIDTLAARGVPIFLVNGRISDYSFRSYKIISGCLAPVLQKISLILCADKKSQERFVTLGASSSRVIFAGNAKYDVQPSLSGERERLELRGQFFENSFPVIVLGSLHPGEESIWFPALKQAAAEGLAFNLIVAPRHQKRFEHFAQKLTEFGFDFARRSLRQKASASVVLLDTIGELEKVYSFSDLAFIGGTLINLGGHNPLEAAAYGALIALGPHTNNITFLAEQLDKVGAAHWVRDSAQALELIRLLATDREVVNRRGAQAKVVWKSLTGASDRIVDSIIGSGLKVAA